MLNHFLILTLLLISFIVQLIGEEVNVNYAPRIISNDGNLKLETLAYKNIYFITGPHGAIYLNQVNLKEFSEQVRKLQTKLNQQTTTNQPSCNCALLQRNIDSNFEKVRRLRRLVKSTKSDLQSLTNIVNKLKEDSMKDMCANNPCHNGGTCINGFGSYKCICTSKFQGPNCMEDVNECVQYANTDLACQNNARCENYVGGYRCLCTSKYTGIHCSIPKNGCTGSSNVELCGHGVCVPDTSSDNARSHNCLCEPGWKLDTTTKTCTVDVNECLVENARQYPCSTHPYVQCINTPGGFSCGSCPTGFFGNGFTCQDINECTVNPNICSSNEICLNTFGSYKCHCQEGMRRNRNGDCVLISVCDTNNGGCSPFATCQQNENTLSGRLCNCNQGYVGTGIGPNGCVVSNTRPNQEFQRCQNQNLCGQNGACQATSTSYSCLCNSGYMGSRCETRAVNPCTTNNPCQNGGECEFSLPNNYRCLCPSSFTGVNCEIEQINCGGTIIHPVGEATIKLIRNPLIPSSMKNYQYPCTWTVVTQQERFIEVIPDSMFLQGDCRSEKVEVFEKFSINEPETKLIQYCHGTIFNAINSTRSSITIRAKLGQLNDRKHGFVLKVITHPIIHHNDHCCECSDGSQLLTNRTNGLFQSPNHPFNYPKNIRCDMGYRSEYGSRTKVELQFITLDLGKGPDNNCTNSDKLTIMFQHASNLLHITGCNQDRYRNKRISTSEFWIEFRSDTRRGSTPERFRFSWKLSNEQEKCGQVIPKDAVIPITIPALSADEITRCTFSIQHTKEVIQFTGDFNDWPDNIGCRAMFDIVGIHISVGINTLQICPSVTKTVSKRLSSNFNNTYVIFTKAKGVALPATTLNYEYKCGSNMDMDMISRFEITSENYPRSYPNNEDCLYVFNSRTKILSVKFETFDVVDEAPCLNDYVEILGVEFAPITKLCNGNYATNIRFEKPVNPSVPLLIVFKSNSSVSGNGFKAIIEAYECGGSINLYNKPRIISYPVDSTNAYYSNLKNCTWTLEAPAGHFIKLLFNRFHLEQHSSCRYDYLMISYGNFEKKYCGTKIDMLNIYRTNKLTIRFVSDSSVAGEGFSLITKSTDDRQYCSYNYTAPFGLIQYEQTDAFLCYFSIKSHNQFDFNQKIKINISIENSVEAASTECHCLPSSNSLIVWFGYSSKHICKECPMREALLLHTRSVYIVSRKIPDRNPSFKFNITYEFINSACGSSLTSSVGVIASPNYPHYIESSSHQCTWYLRSYMGYKVVFQFGDFVNKDSSYYPLVTISNDQKTVNIYRKNDTEDSILMEGNKDILIKYKPSGVRNKFFLSYLQYCYNVVLSEYRGSISTIPNLKSSCKWIITGLKGNKIRIEIDDFDLPNQVDGVCTSYVTIKSKKEFLLRKTCGSNLMKRSFLTSDLPVTVQYKIGRARTNILNAHSFSFDYRIEGCIQTISYNPEIYYNNRRGTIESYKYPQSDTNTDCIWHFHTKIGYSIKFEFTDVISESSNSENCTDSTSVVSIYENDTPVMSICHTVTNKRPYKFQSSTHDVIVKFKSNTLNGQKMYGKYQFVKRSCEYDLHSDSGIIQSPNYPKPYPANKQCNWNITVSDSHVVHMKFLDFQLETSRTCNYDYVSLISSIDGFTKYKLCRTEQVNNNTFSSYDNKLLVKFKSDGSSNYKGFQAKYYKACGGIIKVNEDDLKTIYSPNYPYAYSLKDGFCEWTLEANMSDPSQRIFLYFNGFEHHSPRIDQLTRECAFNSTEIPDESLTVIDGLWDNSPVLTRLCNPRTRSMPVISSGPVLRLKLKSSSGLLIYTASFSAGQSGCGGELYHNNGVVMSPYYPHMVNMEMDCIWIIRGSPGSNIKLYLRDLKRNKRYIYHDFVEIRNGSNVQSDNLVIRSYLKDELKNITDSLTFPNIVRIRFLSVGGPTTNSIRFLMDYSIVYPSDFTSEEGQLASPQYGHLYPYDTQYTWTISRITSDDDSSEKAKISFVSFSVGKKVSTSRGDQCTNGYLLITDVTGKSNRLCGSRIPADDTYTKPITIELNAENYRYPGFLLKWSNEDNSTHIKTGPCRYSLLATDEYQILTSPGYPGNNMKYLSCSWTIFPHDNKYIEVKMLNFSMERPCKYENITLKKQYKPKKIFCGHNLEQFNYLINDTMEYLMIEYKIDPFDTFPGFRLQYRQKCYRRYYYIKTGVIESPKNLNLFDTCQYQVQSSGSIPYKFEILDINLPQKSSNGICETAYIQIDYSRTSKRFCGNTITAEMRNLTIQYYWINIQFIKSQITDTTSIYNYKIKFTLLPPDQCGSTEELVDKNEIISINAPLNSINKECEWKIKSPINTRMRIDFDNVLMRICPSNSYLKLYDGSSNIAQLLTGSAICSPRSSIYTTSNRLFIMFRNSNNVAKLKLKIRIASCGGTLYERKGTIQSPDLVSTTSNSDLTNCIWEIKPSKYYYLNFKFQISARVSCDQENLTISSLDYNGVENIITSNCQGYLDRQFTNYTKTIIIRFNRKTTQSNGYFTIKYETQRSRCGGTYTAPSNEIKSPNYPGDIIGDQHCRWMIKSEITKSITINLKSFVSSNCFYIVVYNIQGRGKRYCQTQGTIKTNSSQLILSLTSSAYRPSKIWFTYDTDTPAKCGYIIRATEHGNGSKSLINIHDCTMKFENYPGSIGTVVLKILNADIVNCLGGHIIVSGPIAQTNDYVSQCPFKEPFKTPARIVNFRFQNYFKRNVNMTLQYTFYECGGIYDSSVPYGSISSPGYPLSYPRSSECEWILLASKSQHIKLTIVNLQLEHHLICKFDYLKIRYGAYYDSPILKSYCGKHNHTNETFVVESNHIRLSFHSDRSVQHQGFEIIYEFIDASSTCVTIRHSGQGSIKSPNYPKAHPSYLRCNWTIVVPPSYQIAIRFAPLFDIEPSMNCRYDSLQIADSNSSIIHRLCGHTPPSKPIISSRNQISLIFNTDFNHNLNGFKAYYDTVCGGIFNDTIGVINSPEYWIGYGQRARYMGYRQCKFVFPSWKNHLLIVQLEISNGNICYYGRGGIKIYKENPNNGNYELYRHICETNNRIKFFHSAGILLQYNITFAMRTTQWTVHYVHEQNAKIFRNIKRSISISTPQFPTPYHHNANLTWIFTTIPNYLFYVAIDKLDIENSRDCKYDYLAIYQYENITREDALLHKLCNQIDKKIFKINSTYLKINFISDRSHYYNHTGFKGSVKPAPGENLGCGGDKFLTESSTGTIKSVDLNNNGRYDNNLYCAWVLSAPFGYSIRLEFVNSSISLERRSQNLCRYDKINIYDGLTIKSHLIQSLCGNDQVDPIISSGNGVRIEFITDMNVNDRGFELRYSVIPSQTHYYLIASEEFQTLLSRDYPQNIDYDTRTMVEIHTNDTEHLEIIIDQVYLRKSTNCTLDHLDIQDTSLDHPNQFRQICETNSYPITFVSSGNSVALVYVIGQQNNGINSNLDVDIRKFKIRYRIYNCNRTEYGYSGIISNVEHYRQKLYSNKLNCMLKLVAPQSGLFFQFYFKKFQIENHATCNYDYLEFTFQSDTENTNTTLPRLCGKSLPASFVSNTSTVFIHFKTDINTRMEGYQMTYVVSRGVNVFCGGNITTDTGVITSPGFGSNRYLAGECKWRIRANKNRFGSLTVTHLQMSSNTQQGSVCTSNTDYVEISGAMRLKLCSQIAPREYSLFSTEDIEIHYKSEHGGVGQGFRIVWDNSNNRHY